MVKEEIKQTKGFTNEKNNTKKWLFYVSIFMAAIVIYKILDNFTNIRDWVNNLFKVISPFIGGILIAYILYLPCKGIENICKRSRNNFARKHSIGLSVTMTYIIALIIVIIIAECIMPILIQSLKDLANNLPGYYKMITNKVNEISENSPLQGDIMDNIVNEINNIDLQSFLNLGKIEKYIQGAIGIVNGIFDAFITIVVSIYILTQRKNIVAFLDKFNHAILSNKTYMKVKKYFKNGNEIFFKFLTSQMIDAFVVGILTSIAMLILKVKYAVLLGFIIGLFNLVPFFGAIVAIAIAIIITLLTGGIGQAIGMACVVIVLQQIDANIINPKIVGSSLEISQLLVIFSVTIGGAYFNVLGMFLAVPIATVIKMMVEDYIIDKEKKKKLINIAD